MGNLVAFRTTSAPKLALLSKSETLFKCHNKILKFRFFLFFNTISWELLFLARLLTRIFLSKTKYEFHDFFNIALLKKYVEKSQITSIFYIWQFELLDLKIQ